MQGPLKRTAGVPSTHVGPAGLGLRVSSDAGVTSRPAELPLKIKVPARQSAKMVCPPKFSVHTKH